MVKSTSTIPTQKHLPRSELAKLQLQKLRAMLAEILPHNEFYRTKLGGAGIDPGSIVCWQSFEKIPFTDKQELSEDQRQNPPYGSFLTYPIERYTRYHQTSGTTGKPLRVLDTAESWQWWLKCWRKIFIAAGITPRDRIFFPFSFGPFIGFWSAFEGAQSIGALCLSGGSMTSLGRIRFLIEHEASCVCCTPTHALRLAEVAAKNSINLATSPVRILIVAGEPGGSLPAVRSKIESRWGARVFDHYGMTEAGALACETMETPGLMHILESEFIVEVVDPQTGEKMANDGIGELVVTNLGRWGTPLIRYRTGDLVDLVIPEESPSARSYAQLDGGILGRSDNMIFIRGNNVYPSAIEETLHRIQGIKEFRVTVSKYKEMMEMLIEVETDDEQEKIKTIIFETIRERFHFSPLIKVVPEETLPRFELKAKRFVVVRR